MPELEMNPEVLASTGDEALCPCTDWRGIPSFLSQLEKPKEILPSTRDETPPPPRCSISREIPPSVLSLKKVLDTLKATQKVPQHTCLHSRGTPSFPPQLKKSPGFPSSTRDESPFPCFLCKGILTLPSHLWRMPVSP